MYANRVALTPSTTAGMKNQSTIDIQRADHANRPRRADRAHCFLNVHGFHHSGTGYLRQTIWGLFPMQASTHHFSKHANPQMEGQHATNVYPDIGKRTIENCSPPVDNVKSIVNVPVLVAASLTSRLLAAYTCPANMAVVTDENKRKLLNHWMLGWNESSTLLIQKTYVYAKIMGAVCAWKFPLQMMQRTKHWP